MPKFKSDAVPLPGDGPPCPRCQQPMLAFRHQQITKKQRQQPFFYRRWFRCYNVACKTTIVQFDADRQWNLEGERRESLERWLKRNEQRMRST